MPDLAERDDAIGALVHKVDLETSIGGGCNTTGAPSYRDTVTYLGEAVERHHPIMMPSRAIWVQKIDQVGTPRFRAE